MHLIASFGHPLEGVAPPQRLVGRFGLGDVDAQRVAQPLRLDLKRDEREVEQRSRGDLAAGQHAGLGEMEPAHPVPDHGRAGLDPDRAPALTVLVGQRPLERG